MPDRSRVLTLAVALVAVVVTTFTLLAPHEAPLPVPAGATKPAEEGGASEAIASDAEATTSSSAAPARTPVSRPAKAVATSTEPTSAPAPGKKQPAPPNPRLPSKPNVHVRLRDPDGRLGEGAQISATLPGSQLPPARSEVHGGRGYLTVEIGHETVVVALWLREWTLATVTVPGPQTMDDHVDAELVVPANLPYLVLREPSPPDPAVPERFLELDPRIQPARAGERTPPTFRRPLRAEQGKSGEYTLALPLQCIDARYEGFLLQRNDLRGLVIGPIEIHAGRNDLGSVQLHAPVELVSGRVIDERNQPYSGAAFEILEADGVLPRVVVNRVERTKRSLFAIRGVSLERPGTSLHLRVSGDWVCGGEPIAFDVGTKGLVVTVVPAGHVVAELLLPSDLPAERLGAALRLRGSTRLVHGSQWKTERFVYGEVRWFGLPAGEYDLLVHPPGRKEPFVVLERLIVRTGERCPDTRLSGIDLTRLR